MNDQQTVPGAPVFCTSPRCCTGYVGEVLELIDRPAPAARVRFQRMYPSVYAGRAVSRDLQHTIDLQYLTRPPGPVETWPLAEMRARLFEGKESTDGTQVTRETTETP